MAVTQNAGNAAIKQGRKADLAGLVEFQKTIQQGSGRPPALSNQAKQTRADRLPIGRLRAGRHFVPLCAVVSPSSFSPPADAYRARATRR